jgi:hypothetical protein
MKLTDITFDDTKKYHNFYLSESRYNGIKIHFTLKDVEIKKNLYTKTDRIFLNVYIEKTNKKILNIFKKLKDYTISHVFNKYEQKIEMDVLKNNYILNLTEEEDKYTLKLEVNENCLFLLKNRNDELKQVTHKNFNENDTIDMKIIYNGILYGKTKFTNNFLVDYMIKNVDEYEDIYFDSCMIEIESEEEDDNLNNFTRQKINIEDIN